MYLKYNGDDKTKVNFQQSYQHTRNTLCWEQLKCDVWVATAPQSLTIVNTGQHTMVQQLHHGHLTMWNSTLYVSYSFDSYLQTNKSQTALGKTSYYQQNPVYDKYARGLEWLIYRHFMITRTYTKCTMIYVYLQVLLYKMSGEIQTEYMHL